MDIEQIRSLFPTTDQTIYLNNASQSPMNTLVYQRLQDSLEIELNPIGKKAFDRNTTRVLLSKLLGGKPEEYALTTSTGVGINIIAQGLEFKPGDNIVIPEREHWNNTFPWLNLEQSDVEVRFAKLNSDNSIDPNAIEALIDDNTRLVGIAAVRFNSGFRPNLKAIGEIAHAKGALFFVDVAQAAGMIPIDVDEIQIDLMAGCGFKWLLGMHGTGFLYINNRIIDSIKPVSPGMFAGPVVHDELSFHKDSRQYETGTIAYTLFDAWNKGLQLLLDVGVENIYSRVLELSDVIIEGLQNQGYNIITPTKRREERTAIVHFNTEAPETTKQLYLYLTENKVSVTLQGSNIRVSPNFFNTTDEIYKFLELIELFNSKY
jgi:selenocysteine lyase/cysteine desulfurase